MGTVIRRIGQVGTGPKTTHGQYPVNSPSFRGEANKGSNAYENQPGQIQIRGLANESRREAATDKAHRTRKTAKQNRSPKRARRSGSAEGRCPNGR